MPRSVFVAPLGMRYLALCTDYDGTLATDGRVLPETFAALERLIASGRRAVLVTGRELDELQSVCPRLDLFEYVVAENGALLLSRPPEPRRRSAKRPPDVVRRPHCARRGWGRSRSAG